MNLVFKSRLCYSFEFYAMMLLEIKQLQGNLVIFKKFSYINIDDARIDATCDAYFKWKDLNTYIKNTSSRGINMPDAISEPMGCYCLGYLWNRGNQIGDATDPITKSRIEFKATSKFDGDLSSFGPKTIHDVIDFSQKVDDKFYYSAEKNKFYDNLKQNMTSHDTTYQWRRVYVRENKSKLVPTLTANMGTGGHNVPLILTYNDNIRKLTPRECFNVQGFPKEYKLPEQSNGRLYKQAGNSVVVPVIERIAKKIFDAINKDN